MMPYITWVQHLLVKAPLPPASLRQGALIGLQIGIALMAVASLNPYFMWGYQKVYYAVATLIILGSVAVCPRVLSLTPERLALCAAFSLYLIYLSLLPKVHGGITRWFFLIPFIFVLLNVRQYDLEKSFDKFYWFFALSLIPGMLVWVWVVAGLPFEFRWITLPDDIVQSQRENVEYFTWPGLVFLRSNVMSLPNGGLIFRLCGIYDEPNSVGTIAVFCLAVTRFRLQDARGTISLIAGIMSFSIAFAILGTIGFIATAIASKRPWLLVAALAIAGVGALSLSGWSFGTEGKSVSNITFIKPPKQTTSPTTSDASTTREHFTPYPDSHLRFAQQFDDRAHPRMRQLFADYMHSSPKTLLFGVASDASFVLAGDTSVWKQVLTNFGVVGFMWVFFLFSSPLVLLWRTGRFNRNVAIFSVLFAMSFYQRPYIWLPTETLLYFAGLYCFDPDFHRCSGNSKA